MTRDQLAHILRAASEIADDPEMLVIGSQSLLATHDEDRLPYEATASMEVDIAFFDDPGDAKADRVDGAIGEWSQFHETFGYYAQGVSVSTAVLPQGWRDRVVVWANTSTGRALAAFLEPHDCVVSKLVAYRPKDRAFAVALLNDGMISIDILRDRVGLLPTTLDPGVPGMLMRWLDANA